MTVKIKKNKYPTGFCANGQCEDTRPFNYKGDPLRICDFWQTCPCACHERVSQMYRMLDLPRADTEQMPEYTELLRQQRAEFVMPEPWELAESRALSNGAVGNAHPSDEGTVTGHGDSATGTFTPTFMPTPTGRRARGQLEFQVLKVCQEFVNDAYEWDMCLPKLVSERIATVEAVEPPSTGAIDAVWDRWQKLGFASRDKKPSRFVEFTGEGTEMELARLKYKAKQDKRRGISEARRNPTLGRPTKRSK